MKKPCGLGLIGVYANPPPLPPPRRWHHSLHSSRGGGAARAGVAPAAGGGAEGVDGGEGARRVTCCPGGTRDARSLHGHPRAVRRGGEGA